MLRNVPRPFVFVAVGFAPAMSAQQPPRLTTKADRIVVIKSAHTMTLYGDGKVLKTYTVWLGRGPGNAKRQKGDNETPEGTYRIDGRNAHSVAYKSLHISYPNLADRERARKLGVDPGGDIMIHGLPPGNDWIRPGQQLADWTYGCIALTNTEMDEVWNLVPIGALIEVRH